MVDKHKCPLCKKPAGAAELPEHHNIREYDCPRCGNFAADIATADALLSKPERHAVVSWLTWEGSMRDHPVLLTNGPSSPPTVGQYETTCIDESLSARLPSKISDRFDRALVNLARKSPHLGDTVNVTFVDWLAPLLAKNVTEAGYILNGLAQKNLIKMGCKQHLNGPIGAKVVLTPEGWTYVADLARASASQEQEQGFVAMWFGNDDEFNGVPSVEFSRTVFDKGFQKGVAGAGYKAQRIDFKEFNDDIVDEILTEIRRSRFLIADLTGHRNGVYFEAGFAKGLGLPVILSCHKSGLVDAHFDIRNYSIVVWDDASDLAKKIEHRIVGTIGDGPLTPASSA